MINTENFFKGIEPFWLGGGEASGYHTLGKLKGIQPFRLGRGGEPSGYHTGLFHEQLRGGVSEVGWDDNVHVPMHTQAQQPHHLSCC